MPPVAVAAVAPSSIDVRALNSYFQAQQQARQQQQQQQQQLSELLRQLSPNSGRILSGFSSGSPTTLSNSGHKLDDFLALLNRSNGSSNVCASPAALSLSSFVSSSQPSPEMPSLATLSPSSQASSTPTLKERLEALSTTSGSLKRKATWPVSTTWAAALPMSPSSNDQQEDDAAKKRRLMLELLN
jgi:hypothetical protein